MEPAPPVPHPDDDGEPADLEEHKAVELEAADAAQDRRVLKERLSARKAELQALLLQNRQLQVKLLEKAAAQRKAVRKARLAAEIEAARHTQALLREAVQKESATLRQQQEQAKLVFFSLDPKTGEVQPVTGRPPMYLQPVGVRLRVFDVPFARGAHRAAHWALVDGEEYVAKRYLGAGSHEETQMLEEDLASQVKARFLAAAFNKTVSEQPALTAPRLRYHLPSVCILTPATDNTGAATKSAMLLEPFIPGNFVKWHLNDGTVLQEEATLQAFSHYSYKHSRELGWQCMVADVQGVEATDGSFLLSDPALLTAAGGGVADMSLPAIKKFMEVEHTCGAVCEALGNTTAAGVES